ncbi:MAG: hypothetical protein WBW32_01680 [Luteibacter sp.]
MKQLVVKDATPLRWEECRRHAVLPIFDEAAYDVALVAIKELVIRGAGEDSHPENGELSRIILGLHAYEQIHHPWPTTNEL